MQIILRGAAKIQNLKRYFTGGACVHGHVAERYTATGQCTQCMFDRMRRPEERAKNRVWELQNYHAHKHEPLVWAKRTWASIRCRCKKYAIPFNMTLADLVAEIPSDLRCPVFGVPMSFGQSRTDPFGASVDRVFPIMGYVKGNFHIISGRANRLKSDSLDPEDLRKVASYMLRSMVIDS
jgi:hypothetical protein